MKETFLVPACSAVTLQSVSGKNYWFRTCDIDTDIWKDGAHVVSFPAGSILSFDGRKKEGVTYGFMGITSNKQDTWLLDGVNEKGLVGGLLFLYEGTGVDKADAGYEGYIGMELVTKFLSVCSCVEEVKRLAEKIQVLNIPYEERLVPATMHYFFTDTAGDEVILEAADKKKPGCFSLYDKKVGIGVMTNSPPYPKQMQNLAWYIEMSPELQAECDMGMKGLEIGGRIIAGNRKAEHLLRSEIFPGTYCSYDRFVRLAVIKSLNEDGRNFTDDKMLALGCGIMSSVYEPRSKGVYHYRAYDDIGWPIGQKDSYTQYLVMYDAAEKKMYLKVYDMVSFVEYSLAGCERKSVTRLEIKHDAMAGILKGN